MQPMRMIVMCFSIAIAVLATSVTHAAGGDSKGAFLKGAQLYEKGEYVKAAEWFRRAYKAQPNWKILYNIGKCEAEARRYDRALEAFEKYLAEGGNKIDADQRKELEAELVQLRSRQAYREGTALFEAEKFVEAATAFRRAYRLNPHWKVLYNIAQSEAAAGRHGLAMEAFEKYYALGAEKITLERQKAVEVELDRLQRLVGFVEIDAPDGAEILIDGEKRGTAPLSGRLMVTAGVDHNLKIVHKDNELYRRRIKVSGRQSISVAVREDELSKPEVEARVQAINNATTIVDEKNDKSLESANPENPPSSTMRVKRRKTMIRTGIALMATGGAGVAASLIVGAVALKRRNDLDDHCPNDICLPDYHEKNNSVDRLSLTSNVLLFAGVGVAVTGAVLFLVGRKHRSKDRLLTLTPNMRWNGAGLVLGGRF